MCRLCDEGRPQFHFGSRRNFLKTTAAAGAAASAFNLLAAGPCRGERAPRARGQRQARPALCDPRRCRHVDGPGGRRLCAGRRAGRGQEDRRRRAEPGCGRRPRDRRPRPDRHAGLHRYAPPPVRDGAAQLSRRRAAHADGTPGGEINYFEYILLKFAPVYRPQDVYINELFGSLSQLDAGVTTVHDISQIHHSPAALGRRHPGHHRLRGAAPPSATSRARVALTGNQYPDDAVRIKNQWFSSTDQLVTMIMGGEIYLPGYEKAWNIGRQLGLQVAAHILSPFGMRPTFDAARPGHGRRQRQARHRAGQPVRAHDRHVRHGLAEGQGRRRAGLARRADRDDHAARHAAHPQDARA